MLSSNLHYDNELRQPHWAPAKCTVAPRQYQKTELWTRNLERKIALFTTAPKNEDHIPIRCLDRGYGGTYTASVNFITAMPRFLNICTETKTHGAYV